MNGFLAVFEDTVEFANPEYLMVVPLAALLLLFGGVIFAVRLGLRPVKTHGSSYPLFGHIKFWFLAILALVAVGTAAARPFWVYGGRSFKRGDVDVAVIVDGSASMWVKDLGPSRLELAVREARLRGVRARYRAARSGGRARSQNLRVAEKLSRSRLRSLPETPNTSGLQSVATRGPTGLSTGGNG